MKLIASKKSFLLPQNHGYFNNCHASTLVKLPDGELLASFFAGEREGAGDVAIWLVSTRLGVWQAPVRQMAESGLAHWNPVLHTEGDTVWLFYKVGPTVHSWTTRWTVSHDCGHTWSAAQELVPGDLLPRGPVKNKLIVMSNGEWLAPGSIETEDSWDVFADISADKGRTWHKVDVPITHLAPVSASGNDVWSGLAANALWETDVKRVFQWDGVIQPTLWESEPGRVHMLMRSTRGFIYRSDSNNYGRSWSAAYATTLPNNNSGIDLVRCDDGRLALVLNPVAGNWGRRYPISVSLSMDNGATWTERLDMETQEGEFSYPAIIADGCSLHLSYTWNRQNMVYQHLVLP